MNPHKQSQFEFFPSKDSSRDNGEQARSPYIFKDLTLSLENVIVVGIISLMTLVLCYAFGVQRGKALARTGLTGAKAEEAMDAGTGIVVRNEAEPAAEESTQASEAVQEAPAVQEKREILPMPIEVQDIVEDSYTIQVASFKLEKNARKEATRLEGIGYDTFVVDKGSYKIVCVGKFAQRDEAKKISRKLKSRYNDLLVRRL